MSFVSPIFFLFLPCVLVLYWLLPAKARWGLLLAASLLFYAWHNIWLLGLIVTAIVVTYLCGRMMEEADTQKGRKTTLGVGAAVCLGLLMVFKYLDFAVGSAVSLANLMGAELQFGGFHILLPMGISFYMFQSMSYVIDVYRGDVKAARHLGYYALFVTFFPQLVAGPIERPGDLLPQLKQAHRLNAADMAEGGRLLLRGYGKKVLIADLLAVSVDRVYADVSAAGGAALAAATVLFAVQIYCDFSGYSDIAQGCARLMGIKLRDNFRLPYGAGSVREFWRRWHISLTDWFTDYLYIPLGGSRRGMFRTCVNTLLTFLVSGLWHGANWTYVLWGAYHGVLLIAERLLKGKRPGRAVTFLLVCFGWIFFRSATVTESITVICRIFTDWQGSQVLAQLGMTGAEAVVSGLLIAILPLWERLPRLEPADGEKKLTSAVTVYFFGILAVVACRFLVLIGHGETSFIYFQF